MSRIIENEKLIEKIRSQQKPSGRYEQIISDHAGEIAMYLCDISKSLAVIADSKKAAIAKYSVGDVVEFNYKGGTLRGHIKNLYMRVSNDISYAYYDIALLSNYCLLTDIEEKDIITVYKKEEEEEKEEKEEEFDGCGNPFLDALYRSFLDLNGRPYSDTGTARSCNCANSYLKKEKEKNEKGEKGE